ncbi:alpha/beta hydrolase [Mycobacterium sp. LTG2003]
MSLLDAFHTTWSQARETFGQGAPDDGSRFDGSSRLQQMKASVEAAAPDGRWQGTASESYAAANKEHAAVYGKLADLDRRMAAEVKSAADVVTAGREQLDRTRGWVVSMASSVPNTEAGQRMLVPIVNKGIGEVNGIVEKSTASMTEIRGRVEGLKGEYDALRTQRFAGIGDIKTDRPDLTMPVPEDPKKFREFWEKLTPAERDKLYERDHRIGNHPGMPFGDNDKNRGRDYYNRKYLSELRTLKQAEVDRTQARVDELMRKVYMGDKSSRTGEELANAAAALRESRHELDGYNAVQATLDKGGPQRYLGYIDDQGHASVSINNPDNASRSAIFVPGTGQDMAAFNGSDEKSLRMYQAALQADPALAPGDVAVTTWMGYDRPMDLVEAANPEMARNGGSALDTFLDGLHASHNGPPAIDTVIGHSYGSTLVGGAATNGNHLAADNVIAVGSPGMLTENAGGLNLEQGANVYSMTARNDIIGFATDLTLGADPYDTEFGATRLWTDPGPMWGPFPSVPAHSSYWDIGNPGLANMGAIIAGMPPEQIVTPDGRVVEP